MKTVNKIIFENNKNKEFEIFHIDCECTDDSIFEDAIRNAISIGGDSDTIGAITVGIAEAYYGIPEEMRAKAMEYLAERLSEIVVEFEGEYPVQK